MTAPITTLPTAPLTNWWRVSLLGHRTLITTIEACEVFGLPMWRLTGDEFVNPAIAVFGIEPWDDPSALAGLPEGWGARRSPTDKGVFVVVDPEGDEYSGEATEDEVRSLIELHPARLARLQEFCDEAVYRAIDRLGLLRPHDPFQIAQILRVLVAERSGVEDDVMDELFGELEETPF